MTLTDQAIEKIREAILVGTLPEGSSITERQVSELLGMSRTPVRAAQQALANEGMLVYESQKGYRIRKINIDMIVDAYKVRAALESLACQIVCELGLPTDTEAVLQGCIDEARELLKDGSEDFQHDKWRDMNDRFHQSIIDAAENHTLKDTMAKVVMMPMLSFKVTATMKAAPDMVLLEGAQRDHEQIFASLKAGQAPRSAARMKEHILVASDLIAKDTRKQQSVSQAQKNN